MDETKPLQFSCMNNCDANDQTNQALPRPKFGQSPEILSMIELCNEKSQNVCYSVTKIAKITKITKFCRAFNKSDKEMRIRGQERPSTNSQNSKNCENNDIKRWKAYSPMFVLLQSKFTRRTSPTERCIPAMLLLGCVI